MVQTKQWGQVPGGLALQRNKVTYDIRSNKDPSQPRDLLESSTHGGGSGIRTHDQVLPGKRLAGARTRPLCDPSSIRLLAVIYHTTALRLKIGPSLYSNPCISIRETSHIGIAEAEVATDGQSLPIQVDNEATAGHTVMQMKPIPPDLVEAEIERSLQLKGLSQSKVADGKEAFGKGISLASGRMG
jgi:hypothetical protein